MSTLNIQNNESIYNLLPVEKPIYKNGRIYKSKYPSVIPPTGSTFGTKNTTMPGVQNCGGYIDQQILNHSPYQKAGSFGRVYQSTNQLKIDPKQYIKKGQGILSSNSKLEQLSLQKNQSQLVNNRYNKSLMIMANNSLLSPQISSSKLKIKEPVPKHTDKPILGLNTHKNYVLENSITNILASPPSQSQKIDYLKKKDYGSIPSYLEKRRQQIDQEYQIQQQFIQQQYEEQNNIKQVPDEEILRLKEGLKQKWDAVNKQYQKYTYLNNFDTLFKIRTKTQLENQLKQIEKDMEKLQKKYIFVDNRSSVY